MLMWMIASSWVVGTTHIVILGQTDMIDRFAQNVWNRSSEFEFIEFTSEIITPIAFTSVLERLG